MAVFCSSTGVKSAEAAVRPRRPTAACGILRRAEQKISRDMSPVSVCQMSGEEMPTVFTPAACRRARMTAKSCGPRGKAAKTRSACASSSSKAPTETGCRVRFSTVVGTSTRGMDEPSK